jgi:hypothetical protein
MVQVEMTYVPGLEEKLAKKREQVKGHAHEGETPCASGGWYLDQGVRCIIIVIIIIVIIFITILLPCSCRAVAGDLCDVCLVS